MRKKIENSQFLYENRYNNQNDITFYSQGNLFLISMGKMIHQVASWLRIKAGGFINFFSGENISMSASDQTSITAGSCIAMDAVQIQLNGGQSIAADANGLTPSDIQVASPKKRAVCKI